MKIYYLKSKLILTLCSVFFLTVTKVSAQVNTQFFPLAGSTTWSTDAFTNLNFFGTIPPNSPPANIATTFEGLTITGVTADPTPQAINDFTGLKLTFSAYVSSDVDKNTIVVLGSDANWGGQGIVIEIDKDQISAVRNFDYLDFSSPPVSFTAADDAGYKANIRQNQYNTFIIDVSSTGVITVNVNGIAYATSYQADISILQAQGNRFTVFSTAFSGFQMKNLKAEKGGLIRTYFTSDFSTKYAESATDWTIDANNELNYNGLVPASTPAVVETTFGGLTTPTATTNDYTGLKLTFDAYVSSGGENTSVVLSSNGSWGLATSRGILIAINRNEIKGSSNFGTTSTLLSSDANPAMYQSKVNLDAYNSFIIDVSAGGVITVTINGYVCPTTYTGGGPLTATLPNPRYAVFGAGFSGFKLKNLKAEKGGVTKTYFTSTLPVSLISYTATKKANGSQLNWETASESQNSHFIIYKSADGSNFKQIAIINGKNQASSYQYLDESPILGDNYYKLVQFDFNGKSEELGVRVVNFVLKTENVVNIYPKPTTEKINLSFSRSFNEAITVKIFNLNGQEVQKAIIPSQKGMFNFTLNLDSKITSGIYIISINSGQYNHSEKILVK